MGDASEHSLFSASGAEGWSSCHGKPAMEEGRGRSTSYADEGTAAHELASRVIKARLQGRNITCRNHLGVRIEVKNFDAQAKKTVTRTFTVDEAMADYVDEYVDRFFLMSEAASVERFCEQKVRYHEYLGVPPALAWGTADGVAILFDQPALEWEDPSDPDVVTFFPPGDELQGHDLKYGAGVTVFARTLQMFLYAAGTLYEWGHVANITRVRLVIHQPRKDRLDEIVVTVEELLDTVAKLRPAVPRVLEAMELARELRAAGLTDLEVSEDLHRKGYLKPSEKACQFCDGRAVCAALIAMASEGFSGKAATPDDFEDLTVDTKADVREYGNNYLANAHALLPLVKLWVEGVNSELMRRHLAGDGVPGVKVVKGKAGNRAYKDKGEVELFVRELPPPLKALMYSQTIKSPAQAEKALKTSPSTWAALQAHIHRPEGKLSIVPASDPRPAHTNKATANDFEDLTEAEDEPAAFRGAVAGSERHPFR